jgi:hypothetical protein
VLVKFDQLNDRNGKCTFSKGDDYVVPIYPTETTLPNKIIRTQLPLQLATCITIHKSQGQSTDNLVMVLGNMHWSRGLGYVAASRCKSSKGLFFLRTAEKDILGLTDFNNHPFHYKAINTAYRNLWTSKKEATDFIYDNSAVKIDDLFNLHSCVEMEYSSDEVDEFGNWNEIHCEGPEKILPETPPVLSAPLSLDIDDDDVIQSLPQKKRRREIRRPPCVNRTAPDIASPWQMHGSEMCELQQKVKNFAPLGDQVVARVQRCCVEQNDALDYHCTVEGREMSYLQPTTCLSSTLLEVFLHSIQDRDPEMANALIVPDHFYNALTMDGYNCENARNWSRVFPHDFMKNPMIFIIPTGGHWIFAMIDPRHTDPAKHTLFLIDPYGHDRNKTDGRKKIIRDLTAWYTAELHLPQGKAIKSKYAKKVKCPLKLETWSHNLPPQPSGDVTSCGILCAMYAYYLL